MAVSRTRSECESGAVRRLLYDYCGYLRERRGLSPLTIQCRRDVVRRFARTLPENDGELLLGLVTAELVRAFVLQEARRLAPGSLRNVLDALRCLLRYAFATGRHMADLSGAVPRLSAARASGLPLLVDPATVSLLLDSCDRSTTTGLRDFAIMTLMVRLGLRANEIASMRLDDLNWHAGVLLVHGKGGQEAPMPLPRDVGTALVNYLHKRRPRTSCPQVFLDAFDPSRGLPRNGVVFVPLTASERTGVPLVGAHRLRHTAASQMLAGGATLVEIGQVLRHRRQQTTEVYTAVQPSVLALAARPWPGTARWTALADRAAQYLQLRRALGAKVLDVDPLLASFTDFVEARAETVVTINTAMAWATTDPEASRQKVARRLSVVRGFASYLQAFEPATQVPPGHLLACGPTRECGHLIWPPVVERRPSQAVRNTGKPTP
jgi:integrase/recombinase XerD